MSESLSQSARKVQEYLEEQGLLLSVVELPDSTRTANEAAAALNCLVSQIVKSLIFKAKRSKQPILVLASGANRVNERKLETLIQEPLGKADANFVREVSGFSIGGVPPVGHPQKIQTFVDNDLLYHDFVWAAAGNPHAVFRISPNDLVRITGGEVADIKE